jgi:hypothetical protein
MNWKFTIIESNLDETDIIEPIGWDALTIALTRNFENHGIIKTIENTDFQFIEDAYVLLKSIYDTTGADSIAFLKVEYQCEAEAYQLLDTFKFDFNTYKRTCGDMCMIEIAVNANSCLNDLMVRMSQDIDLATTTDIDGNAITPLAEVDITLGGQEIVIRNRAVPDPSLTYQLSITLSTQDFDAFPAIGWLYHSLALRVTEIQEIPVFNFLSPTGETFECATEQMFDQPNWETDEILAYTIWERDLDNISLTELCLEPGYEYSLDVNISGTVVVQSTLNASITAIIYKLYELDLFNNINLIYSVNMITGTYAVTDDMTPVSIPFSYANYSPPSFANNRKLFIFFETTYNVADGETEDCKNMQFDWQYDNTSYVEMAINTSCPETTIKGVNLKDTFEFLPTALVGDCYDVQCNDECMADHILTNGLKLRRKPDTSNLFLSWENLFRNTSKIFNLGWGISGSDLIIDKAKQFYQQTNTISLGAVDEVKISHAKEFLFGKVNVGYSKWESEEYNGLDEMNTMRKYSRQGSNSDKTLDLVSQFITAGYTIEITRRKSPFSSDWRYDSDTFVINIDGSNAVQGVTSPTNIVSPSTRYNYRLTPIRNLLNWFNRLCLYSPQELVFNSSNGNFIASGRMTGQCDLEDAAIAENDNIVTADFDVSANAAPYFLPIIYEFSIPLTMNQFMNEMLVDIYENIYSFECNDTTFNGYLLTATYDPNQGMAKFTLLHAIME